MTLMPRWLGVIRIRLAQDAIISGHAAVGDEGLGAVDDPFVAVFDRGGVHAGDVRAVVGLGESAGREHLGLGHLGQPGLLLGLAAVVQDQLGGKDGKGHGAADGGIPAAEFLDDQDVFQTAQALAGVFFGKVDPEESQIAGLLPDLGGKGVGFLQFHGQIFVKFALGEIPYGFLNVLLGAVELKFHSIPPELIW
jgi:hypothetical protein